MAKVPLLEPGWILAAIAIAALLGMVFGWMTRGPW